jgi:DNA-binding CsgD family transcriptional regulator
VSVRTVDAHVDHVRTKLGVRARTQIAVWARLTPTR